MVILVLNAGSSTLKAALFADEQEIADATISWKAGGGQAHVELNVRGQDVPTEGPAVTDFHAASVRLFEILGPIPEMRRVQACGHRVVHGGVRFEAPVRIDASVKQALHELSELAPLHNPPALAGIEAAEKHLPGVPQVAAFDTSFFTHQPDTSYVYPLPYAWYTDWGIRRFGFHGISHAYCTGRVHEMLPGRPDLRLVICHLGNGCSASAVRGRTGVLSTMGFTPLEGLMMGGRSGSIDPGILLHVLQRKLLPPDQLDRVLNHESGLLGVSGVSADFRGVQKAADEGNPRARLALAMYAARVRSAIGALAATLGGLDTLVFTAGVGEHSAWLRSEACQGLEFMGVKLDESRNGSCKPDADIASGPTQVLVLHTREELLIARETQRVLEATT